MLRDIASTKTKTDRTLIACQAVVHVIMGDEWNSRHLLANVYDDTLGVGYVGFDFSGTNEAKLKQHRVYDLAEMLLNLQGVPGFHKRVEVWRKWSAGAVESMFAELQAASLLYLHNVDFKFVDRPENPPKGENYDFEIAKDGERIFAEAKCKLEETTIDAGSVLGSLREAREQVPGYGPAVIFVKIPEQWFRGRDTLAPELVSITDRFLGGTGRVLSVVYHTPFHTVEEWKITQEYSMREVENHKCRFRDKTTSVFDRFTRPTNPDWVRLMDIVEGKYDR